mgnify:CR=1 FL=1
MTPKIECRNITKVFIQKGKQRLQIGTADAIAKIPDIQFSSQGKAP